MSDNCDQNTTTNSCLSHSNCGICLKNNKATCVQGDSDGPLFCGNCEYWKYKRRVLMAKNKDDVNITTRPWNNVFKNGEQIGRAGLRTS